MNLRTKRIKELFGYAVTLTRQEGAAAMLRRAGGFFRRRLFGKNARYLPSPEALERERADAAAADFP